MGRMVWGRSNTVSDLLACMTSRHEFVRRRVGIAVCLVMVLWKAPWAGPADVCDPCVRKSVKTEYEAP